MSASSADPSSGWQGWTSGLVRRPCAGCRGDRGPLCPDCRAALLGTPHQADVRPRPPGLPTVMATADYAGPVREALVAFKDHDRWSLRAPLGVALARSVASLLLDVGDVGAALAAGVHLVPAPGSPGSAHVRDGDHLRELAGVAACVLRGEGVGAVTISALRSQRRRRDQVGLGREQRAANLAGSVVATRQAASLRSPREGAREAGRPRPVTVLVDDLVTTGATLAECARALRSAGVEPLGAAVVAGVRRRS